MPSYRLKTGKLPGVLVLFFLILLIFSPGMEQPAMAKDTVVLGFQNPNQWSQWKPITFPDKPTTRYHFDTFTHTVCSRANSSASGMARGFPGNLRKFPILSWEWKIDHVIENGNAHKKRGDDYPARVYVNFKRTAKHWNWWERTKAATYETFYGTEIPGRTLNFIWANKLKKDQIVKSPYTRHARLIALKTGNKQAGKWHHESVNIRQWYQKAFGDNPPPVQSIAIMTDADNTASSATGCYRNITLKTHQ